MYYRRHHPDNDNRTFNTNHVNNIKYLNIQRYGYGMWLWFSLCWRDILRFIMLMLFFGRILRNNIFDHLGICLIIPHLTFASLFMSLTIYTKIHKQSKPEFKSQIYEWSLCIIGYLMTAMLVVVLLPSSTFYSLNWGQEYGDISRLFTDAEGTKDIVMHLLKYILNNKKTEEIKRRIVVVNYYTTLLFSDNINANCLAKIDYFPKMHNSNKNGLFDANWKDIQTAAGYDPYSTKSRSLKTLLALFVVIYDITLMILVQKTVLSEWSIICCLYIGIDVILVLLDVKYLRIYWYCYHIFPFINELYQIEEFKWKTKCSDIDEMMQNIHIIYGIMFDSMEKVTLLENSWPTIHKDIVNIIGEYLWCPLPCYQYYDDSNEFTLKFEKMLKSFKDCANVSMVCISTPMSTNAFV